jgi:uncharacterized protein Yka (UPF0111/DUF47 family)
MTKQKRLEEIEQMIDELNRSLPAHSIPTAMLLTLEELEEELDQLKKNIRGTPDASA